MLNHFVSRIIYLFLIAILSLPLFSQAQKVVFADDYQDKGGVYVNRSNPSAELSFDETTNEKLLIFNDLGQTTFYWMDANWKLRKKFRMPYSKQDPLLSGGYSIEFCRLNGSVWSLIVGYLNMKLLKSTEVLRRATIDFANGSINMGEELFSDARSNMLARTFRNDTADVYMYLLKNKEDGIKLIYLNKELIPKSTAIKLHSALPLNKSKKFDAADIYSVSEIMNDYAAGNMYWTRHKVHFYVLENSYLWSIADDVENAVAELTYYDKETGAKIKSDILSVEDLIPAEHKKDKLNNAFLKYDNIGWLLSAYKNGGVIAGFDLNTGKRIFSLNYDDKNIPSAFTYSPVMYEAAPTSFYEAKKDNNVKEKVKDISMDKYCTELYKHSCGFAIKEINDGSYALIIGNEDLKSLMSPKGGRTSSVSYYVSTSAAVVIEKKPFKVSDRKMSWNEVHQEEIEKNKKYKKVKEKEEEVEAESDNKKSIWLGTEFRIGKTYKIYLYDGQVKIEEKDR